MLRHTLILSALCLLLAIFSRNCNADPRDHQSPQPDKLAGTRDEPRGGWFTQSPYSRDRIATNTGTSLVIQALEACGELVRPKVTQAQFAAAHAADRVVPPGIFLPKQDLEANPIP